MIAAEEYGRALFMLAQEAGEDGPSDYLCTLEQVDALLQTSGLWKHTTQHLCGLIKD